MEILSGIYKIQSICKPDRVYIGSAKNIYRRWNEHKNKLQNNKHHSNKLQRHYNKYGKNDLDFKILLLCNIDKLLVKEQCFINIYQPYLNGSLLAKGIIPSEYMIEQRNNYYKNHQHPMLGRHHSEETKEKMRVSQKLRYIKSPISDETRKKHSMAKMGNNYAVGNKNRLGKHHIVSVETRNKMSKSRLGISNKKIKVLDTNSGIIYNSISEASRFLQISVSSLSDQLSGKTKNRTNMTYYKECEF
jgi:group I intron endonuclease